MSIQDEFPPAIKLYNADDLRGKYDDLRARAVEMERSEPARKIREYRDRCVATYGKSPTDYESGVVQGIDCALSFLPPAP